MVTHQHTIPLAAAQHTPTDPIPFAIAQHRRAFKAHEAAQARIVELHELFDKEWEFQDPDAIREALTTVHGPHAAEEIARYFAVAEAATTAAQDENEAWRRVATLEPGQPGGSGDLAGLCH